MAKRVLAVLGAVAMLLAAIVIRQAIDGEGSPDGPNDRTDRNDLLVVACDVDLEEVCRSLSDVDELIVEESAATSAGLGDGLRDDVDAWVTSDVWFSIAQGRIGDDIGSAAVLAASPTVVAVDPDRAGAVAALCRDQPLWRCLGDHAGEPWADLGGQATWGRLSTGVPDADTATGLSVLTSIAVSYFGDTGFAANDFPDAFEGWLDALTTPTPGGDPDPAATLVARRGTYSTAGSTAARVSTITRPLDELASTPQVDARIVLVDLAGGDDVTRLGRLQDLLVASGWTTASGPPTVPYSPGVLAALHTLWTEINR